jgi:GT2 family glycosyltransferase
MSSNSIAVVILNYNGKAFLEKFLPNIIRFSEPHKVYVADNASTDESVDFIRKKFPQVSIVQNDGNYGYAKGYNLALEKINADIFILLNNDVEVTSGWIEPVARLMEKDKNIAACQPRLIDYKDRSLFEYAGASGGFIDKYCYPFARGRLFNTLENDKHQYDDAREIFWASGACLFVRAGAFRNAGGLDADYFAHMEEIDLCWRMKNLGYKIFVEPASIVYHVGGGTLNKISPRKTFLNFRNNLTTLVKNHPPRFLFFKIIFRMILDGVAAFKFLISGNPKHFFSVIGAHFAFYSRMGSTLAKRRAMKKKSGFRFSTSCIYDGNIVYEYFLKGKHTFTSLQKKFLPD